MNFIRKIFGGCSIFHDWDNWKVIVNEQYGLTYWRVVQRRTCKCCGKTQISNKIKDK